MEILAHRGLWHNVSEKNTINALSDGLYGGFGLETDIRDRGKELVISHDIPGDTAPMLELLLVEYKKKECHSTLALNIKSDGLQSLLIELLRRYNDIKFFFFDMSVPEMVLYEKMKLPYYTRESDIEIKSVLYDEATGVWMDSFYDKEWLTKERIQYHIRNGKNVAIISPEIHGFPQNAAWNEIEQLTEQERDHVLLCTDTPIEAKRYFDL